MKLRLESAPNGTPCSANKILMALEKINIKGAREHNLKNLNLTLPREKLVVITGLSGSGTVSYTHLTLPTKA